jgi:hypothetical protein
MRETFPFMWHSSLQLSAKNRCVAPMGLSFVPFETPRLTPWAKLGRQRIAHGVSRGRHVSNQPRRGGTQSFILETARLHHLSQIPPRFDKMSHFLTENYR